MNVAARRVPAIEVTGLFDWIVDAVVIVTLLLSGGFVCGTLG